MRPRRVLHFPHPELHITAQAVEFFDDKELSLLIEEMIATMRRLRGIGLAATQIGVHRQIAVIELDSGPIIIINPTISSAAKTFAVDEEGCLSVPGVFGLVSRHASLRLNAQDRGGNPFSLKAHGLFARVIQHEVDHLNGRLFIDRCHQLTSGLDEARRLGLTLPPLGA